MSISFDKKYASDLIKNNKKPAVAITAKLNDIVESDHSRPCDPEMIRPEIRSALRKLPGVNKTSSDIYFHNGINPVGNCAEVNVAAKLFYLASNAGSAKLNLLDVEFSQAIRPRTGQPVMRCGNCTMVFGKE